MIETLLTLAEAQGICAPPLQKLAPSVLDDYWYQPIGAATPSHTGVRVTEDSALRSPTVLSCVRVIAETIASAECNVWRKMPNGGKKIAEGHPLQDVLHDSANEELTSFEFWEISVAHMLTWGNSYARIETDNRQNVVGLHILRPDLMEVCRDPETRVRYYKYREAGSTQATIYLETEIFHVPGLGYDGLKGYSPIQLMRDAIGLSMATEEFAARFFGNNSFTGGYIKHPANLSEKAKEQLSKGWSGIMQGLKGAWKLGVLDEGMEIKTITIPLKDVAFIEMRQFQVEEICRIFRVPPHLVQSLERSTNNNIEHQGIDFSTHTIRPWVERIEARIQKSLFGPRESRQFFPEFDLTSLLRGDSTARAAYFSAMRTNGIIEGNEWRAAEGYNPHAEGSGLWIQGAMVPIARALAEPEPDPADANEDNENETEEVPAK